MKELREEITEMRREQDRLREREEKERRRNNVLITGIKQEKIKERTDLEEWIKRNGSGSKYKEDMESEKRRNDRGGV